MPLTVSSWCFLCVYTAALAQIALAIKPVLLQDPRRYVSVAAVCKFIVGHPEGNSIAS